MSITTITSREFNQDVSKAKKAASEGPVIITDRGKPAHVLLTIEEYQTLSETQQNIAEMLAMPEAVDIDFNPEPLKDNLYKPADLD